MRAESKRIAHSAGAFNIKAGSNGRANYIRIIAINLLDLHQYMTYNLLIIDVWGNEYEILITKGAPIPVQSRGHDLAQAGHFRH